MRSRPAMLMAGLGLIAAAAYAPVAIARQTLGVRAPAAPTVPSAPPHASKDGFSRDERDFTVGRSVYLRHAKTPIGRILATDEHHQFPSTFKDRQAKAVLIRSIDGPYNWLPVEGLSRVYVVR